MRWINAERGINAVNALAPRAAEKNEINTPLPANEAVPKPRSYSYPS